MPNPTRSPEVRTRTRTRRQGQGNTRTSARTNPEAAPQPHDALFKWAFSQREHAAGLLRAVLPPALAAEVDLRTLRVEKGSFIDRALRGRQSDLVLSARLRGTPLYFYTIVEEQRQVQALMPLRMSIYMNRLWEELVRDQPDLKAVPPIVPVLLHQSETGWTAATSFQDIIAVDPEVRSALRPYIPHFDLLLIDLSEGQVNHLVDGALTALRRVVLWCMSVAGDDARLEHEIERIGVALDEVMQAPNGMAALEPILRYLLATHRQLGVARMSKLLRKAGGPKMNEVIWTELDEIERRGEHRGERRGTRRGKRLGERSGRAKQLLSLLAARFGSVPAKVVARVEAADGPTLDRWAVRVLTAATVQEVIAEDAVDTGSRHAPRRRVTAPVRTRRHAR